MKLSHSLFALFAACMLASLFVGSQLVAQEVSMVEDSADVTNSAYFFGYILFATLVLLLVLKYYSGRRLFVFLEAALIFFTADLALELFVGGLASAGIALGIVAFRFLYPASRTLALAFGAAVVGALIGASLDFVPAALLGLALAAYDYYAVFKSKHMVTLAKGLNDRNAAMALTVKSGKESVQLGTGDVVMPAALCVAAVKVSPAATALAFAGTMLGCLALLYVLENRKGYFPALPPLVGGALLGWLAWFALATTTGF